MSTDAGATAAGDAGLDREAVERHLADDAEAAAEELRFQWEDDQRAVILGDEGRQEWYWQDLAFTAASERSATAVLVSTGDGGQHVLPREDAIALRDYLTRAIEGTLPPYEDAEPVLLPGGEEPF